MMNQQNISLKIWKNHKEDVAGKKGIFLNEISKRRYGKHFSSKKELNQKKFTIETKYDKVVIKFQCLKLSKSLMRRQL